LVYALSADNIAPPIASCLGDLITMTLLGAMSTLLILGSSALVPFLVIGVVTLWAIACAYVVLQNEHVNPLLKEGWTPLLASMVITSASGIVLDLFVSRYDGYALLAVAFGGAYSHRCHCTPKRGLLQRFFSTYRHSRRHRLDFRITAVDGLACGGISYPPQHAAYFCGCGRSEQSCAP
jgi:hypothetical protein